MLCCLEMPGPVLECGRSHQVVQQSGGSCVLIQVSFCLDIAHREDADTRFLVSVSQAGMGFASFLSMLFRAPVFAVVL